MSLCKAIKLNKKTEIIVVLAILSLILNNIVTPASVNAKSISNRTGLFYFSQNLVLEQAKGPYKMDYFGDDKAKLVVAKQKRLPDEVVDSVITAYTSTVDQTDDDPFTAASGKRVYDGMIAANWLPFGTKIKIPVLFGDKIFTVDDRMNPRYGHGRLDIWFDADRQVAIHFGVKRTNVEVYYHRDVVQLAWPNN